MVVWKDFLISALLGFMIFSLLSIIFPVKDIQECSGNCTQRGGITDCACLIAQIEPFPAFYLLRIIAPIFGGLLYYWRGKKVNAAVFVITVILMLIALFISYLVFYGFIPLLLH